MFVVHRFYNTGPDSTFLLAISNDLSKVYNLKDPLKI